MVTARIACLSFVMPHVVLADDLGPMSEFMLQNNRIVCVSITDLQNANHGYFYVFDYSTSTAEKMGKPWTIMEPGKCYRIDSDESDVYQIQDVGDERQLFTNYSAYPLTASVPGTFCHTDRQFDPCADYAIQIKQNGVAQTLHPITQAHVLSPMPCRFRASRACAMRGSYRDIVPLKYAVGYPLTWGVAIGSPQPAFNLLSSTDAYTQMESL